MHECLNRSPNWGRTRGNFCPHTHFSVDDGGDEDEANMRNGGDRGECAEREREKGFTHSSAGNLISTLHCINK